MRISDWSSDVCSSDLRLLIDHARIGHTFYRPHDDDTFKRMQCSVDHHDQFIEAIAARDEQAVVDLVHAHWELSRENMEMFITPEGLKSHMLDERIATLSSMCDFKIGRAHV